MCLLCDVFVVCSQYLNHCVRTTTQPMYVGIGLSKVVMLIINIDMKIMMVNANKILEIKTCLTEYVTIFVTIAKHRMVKLRST